MEDDACGELLIANRGHGFTASNLDAIRNSGVSDKEVGDGIGNKGLGFRSVGALTEDVRIYSQDGIGRSDRFWGYCFRFATTDEIEARLEPLGAPKAIRKEVASNIPRYLVPLPLREQPDEIMRFAHAGFATVVVLPLRSADAVQLALQQARPSGSTGGKDGGDKSVCEARINERHLREAQISLTFELSQ